ncbi:uncharacterized protein KY384_000614 [Bacidia gigantensis]|uniref:uncharacterized protein n=1 Tax=Bacidia gigantensis TaxID=2732470 RepID=UPI001D05749E|nr:uncharacterized protein KY384_000614 [Bacidia gigantensis]KAG8525854.1 hypothetical protein KY384_000614 [Bacidia gigantensis]
MARTTIFSNDDEDDDTSLFDAETSRQPRRDPSARSPNASFASDKENRPSVAAKGKARAMGPPSTLAAERETPRPNLKRKLADRSGPQNATQTLHRQKLDEAGDSDYYDPEQSMEQRRALRKDYRDLSRELTDSRSEYLAPGSNGLIQTLNRSNELFHSVKQTSDATLDSRLLVSTADLSMKRTTQLNLGDNTTGIDIDDFVSKCITFMRRGPALGDSAQSQRRRRMRDDSDEDDNAGYDEGDAFNWEHLGRQACYPHNVRPPAPGFLLGPLSVQRRVRKATQRTARSQKLDPRNATRPEEIQTKDLEQNESSNLKSICDNIRNILWKNSEERVKLAEDEIDQDTMSDDEQSSILQKHGLGNDGGILLFNFVVNPKSFGQTIENLFYVSFLIKDGGVGLGHDGDMMPTLHLAHPRNPKDQREQGVQKHQAVFHLDFETWEDIVEAFKIRKSIIPHRQPDPHVQIGATGWYT